MVFSSITFICIFLPAVFLLNLVLPSIKAKNILLVAASLVFYAFGEPVYVFLMLASVAINYVFGIFLDRGDRKKGVCPKFVQNGNERAKSARYEPAQSGPLFFVRSCRAALHAGGWERGPTGAAALIHGIQRPFTHRGIFGR